MVARRGGRLARGDRLRLAAVGVVLSMAWLGLGYRLVQVQVVRADDYARRGLDQRLVEREVAPERGKIFDRNGDPLAMSIEAETLFAVPQQVDDALYTAQTIAALTGSDRDSLLERLQSENRWVPLVRQLEHDVASSVMDMGLAGIYTGPETKRVYPAGEATAQIVGFAGIDGTGLEGLEYVYDDALTGEPGRLVFERGRTGEAIPQAESEIIPATPGADVITTLDVPLQYAATATCRDTVERTGAGACWIVALEVETGEVLALAGVPEFDLSTLTNSDGTPFDNFGVRGMFEPGSTQKLITFSAALDTGAVRLGDVFPSVPDRYAVNEGACERRDDDVVGCYSDFSRHDPMDMSVRDIFTRSSNVGTIMLEERLPTGALEAYMRAFGFGSRLGVEFNGESPGQLNFAAGCSTCVPSAAIGYSVAVTPLQLAAAYAAIGNDGEWIQPHLVRSLVQPDGALAPASHERRRVVSDLTAYTMRQLLEAVVEAGTGAEAAVPGYRVGGKTGTSSKLGEHGYLDDENMASFVGMAPIIDPKVVVAVVVDSPAEDFRTGGRAAAPAFAEMMEAALHRLGVSPDAPIG